MGKEYFKNDLTSVELASYIVNYCASYNKFINMTKLQKLTYCVYGAFLVKNRKIISDRPKLWEHGPFFSKVFEFSLKHSLMPIDEFLNLFLDNESKFYSHFNDDELNLMNNVLKVFCNYSGKQLVDWSKSSENPKSPWRLDLDSGIPLHSEMTDKSIVEFFKTFIFVKSKDKNET